MKVAILGCGPAGLMAAAGAQAASLDADVQVFSYKRKSDMHGAQYLHNPIPHYTNMKYSVVIDYLLKGTEEMYRRKVYGGTPFIGETSVQVLQERHYAWDIRSTYDALWDDLKYLVNHTEVDAEGIVALSGKADLVISTIPAPAICWRGHTFRAQQVWAAGEAPSLGIRIPYDCPGNTVICNGEDMPTWYRVSNIYGHKTVEWSLHSMKERPPVGKPTIINKPIDHNCDCWPNIVRAGRFGEWKKGVLSDSAYRVGMNATLEAIRNEPFNEA